MDIRLPSRRSWRRIGLAILAGVILLAAGIRLFAISSFGRGLVEARIEQLNIRGQNIQVDGLKGDLFGRIHFDRLIVSDPDGVWLNVEEASVEWSPLALIWGHLSVEDVTAKEVAVDRRPQLSPAPETTRSSGSFVSRYSVQNLDVTLISFASGIVGPAQSYVLDGTIDARSEKGTLSLNLLPVQDFGDELRSEISWGGEVPILGNLQLKGMPSGLIAQLLKTPAEMDIEASLRAEGSPENWSLSALASIGKTPTLEINAALTRDAASASGFISFQQINLLSALEARLGSRVDFVAELDAQDRMSIDARSAGLNASLSGLIETDGSGPRLSNMDLELSNLDALALTGLRQLSIPILTARGTFELRERTFDGRLEAPSVSYGSYRAGSVSSDAQIVWQDGSLDLDLDLIAALLDGLPNALNGKAPNPLSLTTKLAYSLDEKLVIVDRARLEAERIEVSLSGRYALSGSSELSGSLTLKDAASIGDYEGAWSVTGLADEPKKLELDGRLNVETTNSIVSELLGSEADILVDLRQDKGGFTLETARLSSGSLSADAKGHLKSGVLALVGDISASAVDVSNVEARGVQTQFSVNGPLQSLVFETETVSDRLIVSGTELERVRLKTGYKLGAISGISVSAAANVADDLAEIELEGVLGDGLLQVSKIAAQWADISMSGDGTLIFAHLEDSILDIELTGHTPTIRALSGLVSFADEKLRTELSMTSAAFGELDLRQADILFSGTWPRFAGSIQHQSRVPIVGQVQDLSGSHGLKIDLENKSAEIDGRARMGEEEILVTSPITISWRDGLISEGAFSGFGGVTTFAFDKTGSIPSLLSLQGISLDKFAPLLNRPALLGELNADATLSIVDGAIAGSASIDLSGLARTASDSSRARIGISAIIERDELKVATKLSDEEKLLDFNVTGSTQLHHSGTLLSIRKEASAPFPIRLKGAGSIAPVWALISPAEMRVKGEFSVDMNNGDGGTFRFSGPIAFEQGEFEDGGSGFHLKDIEVAAAAHPWGIELQKASAQGGNGGRAFGEGSYRFDGNSAVQITLEKLDALNRSDVRAEVSGDLAIDRQDQLTRVLGTLEIEEALINLSEFSGGGYTTLDVRFADEIDETETSQPAQKPSTSVDLKITSDRGILVIGPALETDWGLNATVSGPLLKPQIGGAATLVRGEADLLSRRFVFSEGSLRFLGEPSDAQFLIVAERNDGDVVSQIRVSGTASAPDIELRSSPSLPDDEILSRVLFGASPSQLSPLQAAQLAGAAAQLAGGNAFDLLGQVRAATGLDRIDLGLGENGEATLATGKYIADDVYLELETSSSGAPGVSLEWTPRDNLAIDAEVDPELGPKVAVQWKRDFGKRSEPSENSSTERDTNSERPN